MARARTVVMKHVLALPVALCALALVTSAACSDARGTSECAGGKCDDGVGPVHSPDELVYGQPYAQWVERYVKWDLELPIDRHPKLGTATCDQVNKGPVWFLTGDDGKPIECAVPRDASIMVPIIKSVCTKLEGIGKTEAELRTCA